MLNINKKYHRQHHITLEIVRGTVKINQKNHETPKRSKMCSVNEKNIQISID